MAKKGLWAIIGILGIGIIILLYLLLAAMRDSGDNQSPNKDVLPAPNPPVARIGTQQILFNDIQDKLIQAYGAEMMNQMLERYAMQLEAKEYGLDVDESEIKDEIRSMSQGYDTLEDFYRAMKDQLGLTKEALREDAFYKLLLEKIATRGITITDSNIDAYMKLHADEFKVKSEYHLQQLIVGTREQAEKALSELQRGASFSELVRDRSIDDASAASDGDLGWIAEDDPFVPGAIMTAVKRLETGKNSGVLQIDRGYAIVKVLERRMESREPESIIRERVRKQLAVQEAPPLKEVLKALKIKHGAEVMDERFLH